MRPLIVIFTFLLIATICITVPYTQAQVVITSDNIPMEVGTVMTYTSHSDDEGFEVNVGLEGANREWDFTNLIFDEFETDTIMDPETLEEAGEFPDANLIVRSLEGVSGLSLGEGYLFDIVSDSGWYTIGQLMVPGEGGVLDFPLDFAENPIQKMVLPSELDEEWEVGINYSLGMLAPDTLQGGIFDSLLIRIDIDGFSEFDAWGTVNYSGGVVEALRQHTILSGNMTVFGVLSIMGQRREVEVYADELETTQEYRWIAPDLGYIATITSMPLEDDPEFNLASRVRLRYLLPGLVVEEFRLDFGEVNVGEAGVAEIQLGNEGEGFASITRIEIKEELQEELEALVDLPFNIEPDSSYAMRFLWSPMGESNLGGISIELYHNDPDAENPISISLIGATPTNVSVDDLTPAEFALGQNYPNPFNSSTVIPFTIAAPQDVKLNVVDLKSRSVWNIVNEQLAPGHYEYSFTPVDLPAGIYIYRLTAGKSTESRKLVFLR
ncbi:MAG: T9SS type A sorting domain-containing protein [Calditrichaeota bacterium]|nr:T9SS type A sorting domain-containing protein [Calditrichota bacterium]